MNEADTNLQTAGTIELATGTATTTAAADTSTTTAEGIGGAAPAADVTVGYAAVLTDATAGAPAALTGAITLASTAPADAAPATDDSASAAPAAPKSATLHIIEGGDGPDGLTMQYEFHGGDGEKDPTSRAHNIVHYFTAMLSNQFDHIEALAKEGAAAVENKLKLVISN